MHSNTNNRGNNPPEKKLKNQHRRKASRLKAGSVIIPGAPSPRSMFAAFETATGSLTPQPSSKKRESSSITRPNSARRRKRHSTHRRIASNVHFPIAKRKSDSSRRSASESENDMAVFTRCLSQFEDVRSGLSVLINGQLGLDESGAYAMMSRCLPGIFTLRGARDQKKPLLPTSVTYPKGIGFSPKSFPFALSLFKRLLAVNPNYGRLDKNGKPRGPMDFHINPNVYPPIDVEVTLMDIILSASKGEIGFTINNGYLYFTIPEQNALKKKLDERIEYRVTLFFPHIDDEALLAKIQFAKTVADTDKAKWHNGKTQRELFNQFTAENLSSSEQAYFSDDQAIFRPLKVEVRTQCLSEEDSKELKTASSSSQFTTFQAYGYKCPITGQLTRIGGDNDGLFISTPDHYPATAFIKHNTMTEQGREGMNRAVADILALFFHNNSEQYSLPRAAIIDYVIPYLQQYCRGLPQSELIRLKINDRLSVIEQLAAIKDALVNNDFSDDLALTLANYMRMFSSMLKDYGCDVAQSIIAATMFNAFYNKLNSELILHHYGRDAYEAYQKFTIAMGINPCQHGFDGAFNRKPKTEPAADNKLILEKKKTPVRADEKKKPAKVNDESPSEIISFVTRKTARLSKTGGERKTTCTTSSASDELKTMIRMICHQEPLIACNYLLNLVHVFETNNPQATAIMAANLPIWLETSTIQISNRYGMDKKNPEVAKLMVLLADINKLVVKETKRVIQRDILPSMEMRSTQIADNIIQARMPDILAKNINQIIDKQNLPTNVKNILKQELLAIVAEGQNWPKPITETIQRETMTLLNLNELTDLNSDDHGLFTPNGGDSKSAGDDYCTMLASVKRRKKQQTSKVQPESTNDEDALTTVFNLTDTARTTVTKKTGGFFSKFCCFSTPAKEDQKVLWASPVPRARSSEKN